MLARRTFRGKWLVEAIVDLPIVLPPSVAGLALLLVFGRRGLLGGPLQAAGIEIAFTTVAVILAQTFVSAPFFVRSARTGIAGVDRDLEDAARVDGASERQLFRPITVPLAGAALAAGMVMSWARALGEFGATIMFAGNVEGRTQTLPLVVYAEFQAGDLDAAIAAAAILVLAAFGVLVAVRILHWRSRPRRAEHRLIASTADPGYGCIRHLDRQVVEPEGLVGSVGDVGQTDTEVRVREVRAGPRPAPGVVGRAEAIRRHRDAGHGRPLRHGPARTAVPRQLDTQQVGPGVVVQTDVGRDLDAGHGCHGARHAEAEVPVAVPVLAGVGAADGRVGAGVRVGRHSASSHTCVGGAGLVAVAVATGVGGVRGAGAGLVAGRDRGERHGRRRLVAVDAPPVLEGAAQDVVEGPAGARAVGRRDDRPRCH